MSATHALNSLDSKGWWDLFAPVCFRCANYDERNYPKMSCKAFKAIPAEIWRGENKHTKEYAGDHGIQFTPVTVKGGSE